MNSSCHKNESQNSITVAWIDNRRNINVLLRDYLIKFHLEMSQSLYLSPATKCFGVLHLDLYAYVQVQPWLYPSSTIYIHAGVVGKFYWLNKTVIGTQPFIQNEVRDWDCVTVMNKPANPIIHDCPDFRPPKGEQRIRDLIEDTIESLDYKLNSMFTFKQKKKKKKKNPVSRLGKPYIVSRLRHSHVECVLF